MSASPRTVKVYAPQISVILKKVINRTSTISDHVGVSQRVAGSKNAEMDLTKLLGRGNSVTVRRTVRGPNSGSFTITFPDQMDPTFLDTISGLVEPMDVIEIRMAREPASELPIVLRGFVSEVIRDEMMTREAPARSVTVSGHDYMKVLQLIRFIYLPTMIAGQDLLSAFKLALNYKVDTDGSEPASGFVQRMIEQVAGDFLSKMKEGSGGETSPITDLKSAVSGAQNPVMPFGVQEWQGGTLYDLLAQFGDVGAWNELYVEDRDDGPYVVYRPTPFKTAAGDYIQSGASADELDLTEEDVIGIQTSRSDSDVANYFWVDIGRMNLLDNPIVQQDQTLEPSPALDGYQNADPRFYGIRLMRESSNQGVRYDGKSESDIKSGQGVMIDAINEKRRILIENNKDNVVLESGTLVLKGSEKIKAGMYLNIDRGGFKSTVYAYDVVHQYTIGGAFLTRVSFDRGTGFIERVKRDTSAYLAELTIGGTYE